MGIQQGWGTLFRTFVPVAAVVGIAVGCGSITPITWVTGDDAGAGADGTAINLESGTGDGTVRPDGSPAQDGSVRPDGSTGRDASSGEGGGTIFYDGNAPEGSGVICVSGMCGCPPYETLCNGTCIVTNLDPNNCGGCGHACAAAEACSAGVCSPNCTTPTVGGTIQIVKCGQNCVDIWTDNKNCGACGTDCTVMGQVCAGGTCVAPTILVDAGGVFCTNGGPLIDVTNGSIKTCVGTLAQTTFRFGVCACGNVSLVNSGQSWPAHPGLNFPALYIDAYDSSKGPWDMNSPEIGGSLGVNGTFTSNGGASTLLTGHWWDWSSISAGGLTDVKQELHAVGPITASGGPFNVGQPNGTTPPAAVPVVPGTAAWDGYVIGNINAGGGAPMTFYKDLYVPAAGSTRTGVTVVGSVKNASFAVPPPCDSCGASQIPVGSIVDKYAVPTMNNDATIGLSPAAMSNLSGTTRLDLPCGYYYLDSINSSGNVTVYAHGHTALFIGGNASAQALSFSLDPGGSFDVFIKGTIMSIADLVVGNPNYAALTRVYVGSPGLTISGEAHFAGLFYAAGSDISLTSHITAYGALYCNNFIGQGDNTDVHYDKAALRQGYGCDIAPSGCVTCADCGNQACINGTCGACTSSAQCCPPLICSGGTCQ